MMRTFGYCFWVALAPFLTGVPGASAQQQPAQQPQQQQSPQQPQNQTAQPIPAYRTPLASGADNGPAEDTGVDAQQPAPDTTPLAGALGLSLGAPRTTRSFWQPYVDVSATAYSNPINGNGTGWATWSSISGGIDLHEISGNSNLTLSYASGASISSDGSGNSVNAQQLGLAERLTWRRLSISVMDQFGYLPQASFGYNGLGNSTLTTGGDLGLQTGFTPNQSILTSGGQRVTNTSLAEVDAFLTRRSTVSLIGSYGLLHYFENNLADTNETTLQAGYSYLLSRKNTIALLYRFDAFRYQHAAQSINDHSVQVSFARRVTGRLTFLIAGGPDVAFSQTPISTGPSSGTSSSGSTTGKTRQFFWDVNSSFDYRLRRFSLGLGYTHGVTGGSGVLAGAVTDGVTGYASRQLTPKLNGGWSVGYARNTGLAFTPTSTLTLANQTYDYWFSGVNLTRTLGRSIGLTLGYQVQYQNSNSSFCVNTLCGVSFISHQISVDVGWHPRPFTLKNRS